MLVKLKKEHEHERKDSFRSLDSWSQARNQYAIFLKKETRLGEHKQKCEYHRRQPELPRADHTSFSHQGRRQFSRSEKRRG